MRFGTGKTLRASGLALAGALVLAGTGSTLGERKAQDWELPLGQTMLCIEEQSTGLTWSNGGWKKVWFTKRKLLVVKSTPMQRPSNWAGTCAGERRPGSDILDDDDDAWLHRCYNVREVGERHDDLDGIWCREFYRGRKIYALFCESQAERALNLKPNGWFHLSEFHANLKEQPKDDRKGSLLVSVGKCSTI